MSRTGRIDFEERFFDRQRREIMARVAQAEARRRARRRALLPVAAALLFAVLALDRAVVGPPAPAAVRGADWLFAWDVPGAESPGAESQDPLAAYAPDALEDVTDATLADSTVPDLLPPLADEPVGDEAISE